MATFREIVNQIKIGLASAGNLPGKKPIVKEILRRAADMADPPPSKEEFVEAMVELGLQPGYD